MNRRLISLLLLVALTCGGVSAFGRPQDPQRERRATAPSPTPSATPPAPSATSDATPVPATGPTMIRPATGLTAAPRTALRADTTRTLAELQTRIAQIVRKPELQAAMIGIKVASLDTGRVLFEENANKLLRPASNMKLYTVSTALDRLSPDFRFNTSVYAAAQPDANGVVHRWLNGGGLTVYGRGDPSIAARFNNRDYFKGIDQLAAKIAGAGVKRIEGDLVGDESYFIGPQFGSGWEWDDLTWYYGAEISALTINDNALDLFVKPGPRVGAPAEITTGPPDPFLAIVNRVTTGTKGAKRELNVYRGLGESTIEVSGIIPVDDSGYTGEIAISNPAMLFLHLLRSALAAHGVTITGNLRVEKASRSEWLGANADGQRLTHGQLAPLHPPVEITSLQSPPLSLIAAKTLKPSQNLYTELILRTLGKQFPPPLEQDTPTTEYAGIQAVKAFLKEAGLHPDSLVLSDGSGLSRNDMVTAEATVQLLTYMSKHRYAQLFREALPIAGVDGTLRNRLKGTVAENNVRAKTGSLSSAASLSGYVTTAAGEKLVFSIMVNNYPADAEPREVCIDPIAVLLASFAGKS